MTASTTRLLLILAAFVAGLASVFAVVLVVAGREPGAIATPSSSIGGPFRLIDQSGRAVTDQDFKGHPFLVFFGYTHCPDVCPTTLFEVSEIFGKLGADAERASALFVTVDPERDTPEALKDYLSSFNPRLLGLTGDVAAIETIAREYRVYMKKVPGEKGDYAMDHTALVYLMDRDGRFVAPFNIKRKPEDAAADLRKYL
jgi:protein SCO1/2